MERMRAKFEQDLRAKLQQRCSVHMTFLLKAFHFFGVDNSRTVSLQEQTRAIEKSGVLVEDESLLESIFHSYDRDGNCTLDYEEFIASVLEWNQGCANASCLRKP